MRDLPQRAHITGVVLAGGHARRMGQRDKGLVSFAGKPLVAHAIAALQPQVATVMISANRNIERYRAFGYPVVQDADPGYLGPLAGIATAMREAHTPWLLLVPCDMPLLPADLGERLCHCVAKLGAEGCAVRAAGRPQPLCALLHRDLAAAIDSVLASGRRAVLDWAATRALGWCDFSDEAPCFLNLNTPADVARCEAQLGYRLTDD